MTLQGLIRRVAGRLGLVSKTAAELGFWRDEIGKYVRWYEGKQSLFGDPPPGHEDKVTGFSREENAVRTRLKLHGNRYINMLRLPPDIFAGGGRSRLLDIGCGPIPYALAFSGCEVYGLDELLTQYRRVGFPLHGYGDRIRFLAGQAEHLPFPDATFDGVISVNALDHVADIRQAAGEALRVLRPGGIFRTMVLYHPPTKTEPWALNDERMTELFAGTPVRKLLQIPHGRRPGWHVAIWGAGSDVVIEPVAQVRLEDNVATSRSSAG